MFILFFVKSKKNKSKENKGVFVVQLHDASNLHHDFRLEIDGVLKSWAIPKLVSTSPENKRLAIEVEDHSLEYGDFEGVIPEGNYGAGPVMLWDNGRFYNVKKEKGKSVSLEKSYKNGRMEIFLEGKKLRGAYALIKLKGQDKNWLLIKMKDEYANKKIKNENKSVKSGKTLRQIEKGK